MIENPWSWLLIGMLVLAPAGQAAENSPIRNVNVAYDGETYVCDVVILAPVRPAVAWEVLTDFEHMASWVPNVRDSTVLKREDESATVEQRGLAVLGPASLPYTTERRIEMHKPTTIRSIQVKGNLNRFESLMMLESDGSGTRLTYHLEIVPGLIAGSALSRNFLEHEISEQFSAIVEEMVRRARTVLD